MEYTPLLVGRSRALEIIIGADDFSADIAERYGLINRTLPDNELDGFVYNYAMRVSQFDKEIIKKAKSMINIRAGAAPKMEHLVESRTAFIEANMRPERKPVVEKITGWVAKDRMDYELNIGEYLGRISDIK